MIKGLRRRFVGIVMAIVVAMLCVIFGLVIHFTAQSLEDQSLQTMQELIPEHGTPPEIPDEGGPPHKQDPGLRPELPPSQPRPRLMGAVCTVDISPEGEVLGGEGYLNVIGQDELPLLLEQLQQKEEDTGVLEGYRLRYQKHPIPGGYRVVLADISSEIDTLVDLIKICFCIGSAALLTFWFLSVRLAKWAVAPMEEAWQQQKQFVADASHELKTPLAVITTNAELLQDQGQPADNILIMSRQMRRLVEGMLELARVDNGIVRTTFQDLDLGQLITETVLPFEPLYYERGLTLEYRLQEGIRVKGSQPHLKQVMDILLDNAMKYSAPGSRVEVRLERQCCCPMIRVYSPGTPLPKEELGRIFKRFYRVDKSRGRDGSYGLGLSIAQRILQEHRGRIWAESDDGGNVFCVQLPPAAGRIEKI